MRNAFIAKLSELTRQDSRIVLITGDLGYNVLESYAEEFPDNFLNAGVAEQNMMGVAAGMALEGRVVFTYSIANFPTLRCLEQIRNDACYHNLNVNIVSIGGGFSYGQQGFSHHATEDISILRALPNMTVAVPGCDWEAECLTESLVKTPGVGYLRLDRSSPGRTESLNAGFSLGKVRQLTPGTDLTLLCAGGILEVGLEVQKKLNSEGVSVRLLSAHTIKPFQTQTLVRAARETGGIITLEENNVDGGVGSAVAESLMEQGVFPGFFYRMGLRRGFATEVGTQAHLRTLHQLDSKAVYSKAKSLLKQSSRRKLTESQIHNEVAQ